MSGKDIDKPIGGESTSIYNNKIIIWTKAFWNMDFKLWPHED